MPWAASAVSQIQATLPASKGGRIAARARGGGRAFFSGDAVERWRDPHGVSQQLCRHAIRRRSGSRDMPPAVPVVRPRPSVTPGLLWWPHASPFADLVAVGRGATSTSPTFICASILLFLFCQAAAYRSFLSHLGPPTLHTAALQCETSHAVPPPPARLCMRRLSRVPQRERFVLRAKSNRHFSSGTSIPTFSTPLHAYGRGSRPGARCSPSGWR